MPKISVVIPTYNRINSLLTVLKKLENQDFSNLEKGFNFEVIIVNDGSTDNTEEKLNNFKTNKFNLKILFQENKKQGTARNFGVKNANSDLIIFIQDDIFPDKNFISKHYNFHKKNSKKEVVTIGKTEWLESLFGKKGEKTQFYRFLDGSGKNFSSKIFFKFFGASLFNYEKLENGEIKGNNFFHFYTNNLSIKKEFYIKNGGFNEKFNSYGWEDIEFGYRLYKKGMKLFYLKKALAKHNHEYNLEKFLNREKKVSENLVKFLEIQPELKNIFYKNRKLKNLFYKIFSSKIFLQIFKILNKNLYWYFLGKK